MKIFKLILFTGNKLENCLIPKTERKIYCVYLRACGQKTPQFFVNLDFDSSFEYFYQKLAFMPFPRFFAGLINNIQDFQTFSNNQF